MIRCCLPVCAISLLALISTVHAGDLDGQLDTELEGWLRHRSNQELSWREQQVQIAWLSHASGLWFAPTSKYARAAAARPQPTSSTPIDGYPDILIGAGARPAMLRELAKALQDGWGSLPDYRLALELFRTASDMGDAEAQGQMGLRYALGLQEPSAWEESGIQHFGEPDEESAILHYYFAALGGDAFASMALGYRHLNGLGVPKSCLSAASYYQPVAERTADLSTAHNTLPQVERLRLSAQASTSGLKAERHKEVVQYYQYSADQGNVEAQAAVGQVLNAGTHGVSRDHPMALHYLRMAAEAGDPEAMTHLGHMYANGMVNANGTPKHGSKAGSSGSAEEEGTKRAADLETAKTWFETAAREGSAGAMFGLGTMYLTGEGAPKDLDEAFRLFGKAAEQGHPESHFFLGMMHFKGLGVRRRSMQRAFTYFSLSSHTGHLLSMYNVATMHLAGKGTQRNCNPGTVLLKAIAERGPVAAVLQRAHESFFNAHHQHALLNYLMASEAGMEVGQSNVVWMLEKGYVKAGGYLPNITFRHTMRSAEQGNVASLMQMGDAYLYGMGVPQDWVRSSAIYYEAFQERSAEAMFNLGFAHEFGLGVVKDFNLARRFFDMSKHTQSNAAAAVFIAKCWLALHEAWEWVRPHLPSRWDSLWDHVLTIEPPYTTVFGAWAGQLHSALPAQLMLTAELAFWKWAAAVGIHRFLTGGSGKGGAAGEGDAGGGEFPEIPALLSLLVVLYVVMRVRGQRAARLQERHQREVADVMEAMREQQEPTTHNNSADNDNNANGGDQGQGVVRRNGHGTEHIE